MAQEHEGRVQVTGQKLRNPFLREPTEPAFSSSPLHPEADVSQPSTCLKCSMNHAQNSETEQTFTLCIEKSSLHTHTKLGVSPKLSLWTVGISLSEAV